MATQSLSSQLRAMSKTARDRVLPAPKTLAIHKSDLPVRMASNNAIELSRHVHHRGLLEEGDTHGSNCHGPHPSLSWPGVKNRFNILTNASVSCVLRSLAMRRTGICGCTMPIANGRRDWLACANTKSSWRLRVSPERLAPPTLRPCSLRWVSASPVQDQSNSLF